MIDRIDPIRGDIAEMRHSMDARFVTLERQLRIALYLAASTLAATIGLCGVLITHLLTG